ncbi:MAG: peptidylprolyl isomerase [Pseudomonadota bacterium]
MEPLDLDLENTLIIDLDTGEVVIALLPGLAPLHTERLKELTRAGEYDNVAFHRVLDDFVAQTGDVQFGDVSVGYDTANVGTGNSTLPDLPLEASQFAFDTGVVGMARAANDVNSANSQFFITYTRQPGLDFSFTIVGVVVEGMELIEDIAPGTGPDGLVVNDPVVMRDVEVAIDALGQGATEAEAFAVALLYEVGLNRDGELDFEGYNFWIDRFEEGRPFDAIAQRFLESQEFEDAFGPYLEIADRELVQQFYRNVLDREGEQGGVDFWTGRLGDDDFDQADLLVAFAFSEEFVDSSPFDGTPTEVFPGDWMLVA